MPDLFPEVPEDLSAFEPEVLQDLLNEFTETAAALIADMRRPVSEREIDIGDMSAADLLAALRAAAEDRKRIEQHLASISEGEKNFLEELAAVAGELGVASSDDAASEGESEPEPESAESDVQPDEQPAGELAQSDADPPASEQLPAAPKPLAIPRGPARFDPQPTAQTDSVLVATAGLGAIKIREGTPLDRAGFANAVRDLARLLGPVKHVRGGTEDRFPVARIEYRFPEEFRLGRGGADEALEKIRAVSSVHLGKPSELEVFQASGGICAPPTPFYDVPGFATRARPVRDALPSFQADRGGVSLPSVATINRADTGVDVIEEADDAQGGTFAAKSCRTVECATWTDTFVGTIYHCLEVGTLNARTWPEGIALEQDNQLAAHAAVAETRLLDRIKALSIKVTASQPYNGVHGFIYAVARAKAGIRNRLRADLDVPITCLVPEWVREFMVADLAAQSAFDDRYVAVSQVERYYAQLGVNVVWYKDSPSTGPSQNFSAETAGALDDFPTQAQWALFLNGTFLHLDGGSLELGLVRDSTLNSTNDHQLFGETFENVARVGPEQAALWITSTICPSGTFPAPATALSC
jgi:hypothetical protein